MRPTPAILAAACLAAGAGIMIGSAAAPGQAAGARTPAAPSAARVRLIDRNAASALQRANLALKLLVPVRSAGPVRGWGADSLLDAAVTTAKLAVGAVTTDRLADGAVTTPKLADGAVAGGKIAPDAVSSDRLAPAVRDAIGATRRLGVVRLFSGATATLAQAGSVTVTAYCRLNDSGADRALVLVSTTMPGAAFDAEGQSSNLLPASIESERKWVRAETSPGNARFQAQSGALFSPDGAALSGTIWAAVNHAGHLGECQFGGYLVSG